MGLRRKIFKNLNVYFSVVDDKVYENVIIIELFEKDINFHSIHKVYDINLIRSRFLKNNRLFCVLDNNLAVSYAWSKTGKKHFIGEINKHLCFEEEVNCIFDCLTLENFQGKGYYSTLISYLAKCSLMPTFIYAYKNNIGSNKGIKKGGFMFICKIKRFIFWTYLNNKSNINFSLE